MFPNQIIVMLGTFSGPDSIIAREALLIIKVQSISKDIIIPVFGSIIAGTGAENADISWGKSSTLPRTDNYGSPSRCQ
jgi:hypothetical protein